MESGQSEPENPLSGLKHKARLFIKGAFLSSISSLSYQFNNLPFLPNTESITVSSIASQNLLDTSAYQYIPNHTQYVGQRPSHRHPQ
jgi:hypothetical protein